MRLLKNNEREELTMKESLLNMVKKMYLEVMTPNPKMKAGQIFKKIKIKGEINHAASELQKHLRKI